jgi:hypothetical protein
MRHKFSNAVLFSKHPGDKRQLRSLCSRVITILSVLWSDCAPRRRPWIDGGFAASFRQEEIATDTGYKLSGIGGRVEVIGRDNDRRERVRPNLVAICGERKWPAFVYFDEVGYDDRLFFREGMDLAVELVNAGYEGAIRCYSDCIDNEKYENPERCVISISEDGFLSIRIHWGDEILIGPLLDFCRAEGFTEEDGREEWEKGRKTA